MNELIIHQDKCSSNRIITRHPLSGTWYAMVDRCHDSTNPCFHNYGCRGISVCEEWRNDFWAFADWADAQNPEPGTTLDRIDNDGNYEPNNCRFVSNKIQGRNKRNNVIVSAFGETKTMQDWVEDPRCVVGRSTLNQRINSGYAPELSMITPKAGAIGGFKKNGNPRIRKGWEKFTGALNSHASLSESQAEDILQRFVDGESRKQIACVYIGIVTIHAVRDVISRRTWQHLQMPSPSPNK